MSQKTRTAGGGESNLSSGWRARYVRCMRKVWSHPNNDQRAAVTEWLLSIVPESSVIVDIGAGDGYFAPVLRPSRYLFVEPVPELFGRCAANLKRAGVEAKGFRTVGELFQSGCWESADIVLLVHVLLYLTLSELEVVAEIALGRPCAMVYPDPERSVTVEFEDKISIGRSREILARKKQLFGSPDFRKEADTHFRFRPGTRVRDIAFVVSHLLLRDPGSVGIEELALSYVQAKLDTWRRGVAGWELPQAQLMENWRRDLVPGQYRFDNLDG